jgi:iron complex transport system ATP-binding protein
MVCLLGPNGSGKSTLIKTLAGVLPALSGTIALEGLNMTQISNVLLAQKRSMVLTENIKADHLNVEGLVAMGRIPYTGWLGKLNTEDKRIIENTLVIFGLSDFKNRTFNNLSDGEKQKVLIARAFAQQTPIIFLDEPTAFLDIPNKMEIMQLLKKLSAEENRSIIISTHDLELATQSSGRLLLISKQGKFYSGCPEDLMLGGQFDEVFGNKDIRFNIDKLRFIKSVGKQKVISLDGDSSYLLLTEKALNREGFSIGENQLSKVIVRKDQSTCIWMVEDAGGSIEFKSMEQMLGYLNRNHEA